MSTETATPVQLTEEGMLPIPPEFRDALGLKPTQIVWLTQKDDSLIVRTASPDEVGDRLLSLLHEALGDTTWEDISALRASDEDWR